MKILITGGAGFIGSHLADRLVETGHSLIILDDFSTGQKANIEHLTSSQAEVVTGSVCDEALVMRLVADCDMVYHLAAAVGVKLIMDKPLESIITNVEGTATVLKAADKHKKKIFVASTSEVYGKNTKLPFNEEDDRTIGPPSITRWHYAESKALDEFLALAYHQENDLQVIVTRFFNTTGPRQSSAYGMALPRFIDSAMKNEPITVYGDGKQQRCFGYVGDMVEALVKLIDCKEAVGQVINLGNDEEISILELAQLVKKVTGSSSPIVFQDLKSVYGEKFEDMARRVPDISKAKSLIDWQPKTGVRKIVDLLYESRLAK